MATKKTGMIQGVNFMLLYAVIPLALGILMFIVSPYEFFTQLRIRMIPGFFSYNWWLEPPVQLRVNIYFFNVTNADAFMSGTDSKIKVEEVGPVTYWEKLIHKNPVFNENGTFSYTAKRELIYLPEANAVNLLNATVIMPNLAALVVPSYIFNAPFAVKLGMNILMRRHKTQLLKKTTIYNYLWNSTDPFVDASSTIAPGIFPIKNVGVMTMIYRNLETNATVYIGPKYDRSKFFKIDRYGGSEYLPQRENNCHEKIVGATDDITYHLDITKNDTLRFYSRGLCTTTKSKFVKSIAEYVLVERFRQALLSGGSTVVWGCGIIFCLTFADTYCIGNCSEGETTSYGMAAYRFEVPNTFFDRTFPEEKDCYKGSPSLPNGMIDCGACYFDTSVTASFPHFMYADELQKNIDGMKPEQAKHESYLIVEPKTGIPLDGATRLQMNIAMKDMKGFLPQLRRFSNLNIPFCWIEYTGNGYPWHVITAIYLHVVVTPISQVVVSCLLITVGLYLMYVYLSRKKACVENSAEDRMMTEESDMILNTNNKLTDYLKHYDYT